MSSNVVFGICNERFLEYRKFKLYDSKVSLFSFELKLIQIRSNIGNTHTRGM